MDPYQEKALGIPSEADRELAAAKQHKIGTIGAVALLIFTIVLDAINYAELGIPITDAIAWICEIAIIGYLYYVGASQFRQIAANVITWLAELIPIVDLLPLYTLGIVIVIAIDRNETLRRVAEKVPAPKGKVPAGRRGRMTQEGVRAGGGRPGSRLSQNKIFGAASEERLKQFDHEWSRINRKLPGKLRGLPERHRQRIATQSQRIPGKLRNRPDGDSGPDIYGEVEREINPGFAELLANIDVSGEQVTREAERRAHNTPNAS
jgi:hypothetical protein